MNLLDRFLAYVAIDTRSEEGSPTVPSTLKQLDLSRRLADELRALGAADVFLSEGGIVYARVPASPGLEARPALGFLAHVDTSPDASGADVKPRVLRYGGGVVPLGESGLVLDPGVFPDLGRHVGERLVVTDGTTLLGADDKAGVAIVMTAVERWLGPDAPAHCEIRVAFTPDEEIGEGTRGFDPARFGARVAFTVDGADPAAFENANFNAAYATFSVKGVSVHPGSAKGVMVNAVRVAAEIVAALPADESPELTEGRQGFYHPVALRGDVSAATLSLLVRDHDAGAFSARKARLEAVAEDLNARYGAGTVALAVRDQYRNMEERLAEVPRLAESALAAIRSVGLVPRVVAVRGGTDGAALAQMGIPCPNLGTGGRNYHGEHEYAVVEEMEKALGIVLHLAAHLGEEAE